MLIQDFFRYSVAACLLAPYLAAAQQISIGDAIKGSVGKYAVTIKPSELPDDFVASRVAVGAGSSPLESVLPYVGLFNGQSGSNDDAIQYLSATWSNGDIVRIGSHDYLVTYKLDGGSDLITRFMPHSSPTSEMPSGHKGVQLRLSLTSIDSIQSITPLPELKKSTLVSLFESGVVPQLTRGPVSDQTATLSNIKQVALGMIMYTTDYDDTYPFAQGVKAVQFVTYPYIKNAKVWKSMNPNGSSILFNLSLGGVNMASIPEPANTILFYESAPWPDGRRAVAFTDGHAKLLTPDLWDHFKGSLKLKGFKRVAKPLPMKYGEDRPLGSG